MYKKIFFNLEPNEKSSSNGGGNYFVMNLKKYLQKQNFKVVFDLDKDIDLIFIIDPRKNEAFNKKFGLDEILEFKRNNPAVKLIYRVNENDIKRKNSINIEPLLVKTIKSVDYVVFVSEWLKDYFIDKYNLHIKSCSIINGCNINYFYCKQKKESFINNKIKLVTHHNSNNYLKGFHIYNKIDKLLNEYKNIEFTYIGNYNKEYKPKNIKILPSCNGEKLGNILRQNDIYITATQYEPGAMHYVEGLSCGLPVLYCRNGGGTHEVCKVAGEEYHDIETMIKKMTLIKENYDKYISNINYKYLSSKRCCEDYVKVIQNLLE